MKRGISSTLAVMLLIALGIITAVGLYFWVGGFTGPRDGPLKPHVISIKPMATDEGKFFVSNPGTEDFTLSELKTSESGVTCDFNGSTTLSAGSGAVCYMPPKVGPVSLYGNTSAGRFTATITINLGEDEVPEFSFFRRLSSNLTYTANDADGLEWVALTENGTEVAGHNNTVTGCDTFYTNTYPSYSASSTYVGWYKDCDGNTVSSTYSP